MFIVLVRVLFGQSKFKVILESKGIKRYYLLEGIVVRNYLFLLFFLFVDVVFNVFFFNGIINCFVNYMVVFFFNGIIDCFVNYVIKLCVVCILQSELIMMRKRRVKMNMYYSVLEFCSKFLYYCIVKYMKIYIFF